MAFQPCPNIWSVAVHGSLGPRDVDLTNVFHISNAAVVGLTQAVADTISPQFADLYDDLKPFLNTDVEFTGCTITDLTTASSPQFTSTTGWPKIGTSIASPLPDFLALTIEWRGAGRGAAQRGRTFFSGWTADGIVGDTATVGAAANLLEGAGDLTGTLTAASFPLVILSRRLANAPRANGIGTIVTNFSVPGIATTQRGRKLGA